MVTLLRAYHCPWNAIAHRSPEEPLANRDCHSAKDSTRLRNLLSPDTLFLIHAQELSRRSRS